MTALPTLQELRRAIRRRAVSRRGRAAHESGHAAAALHLGLEIERISLGSLRLKGGAIGDDARGYLWRLLVIYMSGAPAHRRVDGSEAVAAASADDVAQAVQIAAVLSEHPRRTLEKARRYAERIISKDWPAVSALADELDAVGELRGDRVAEIFHANRKGHR